MTTKEGKDKILEQNTKAEQVSISNLIAKPRSLSVGRKASQNTC